MIHMMFFLGRNFVSVLVH